MLKTYIIVTIGKKHNKFSISFSKTDAGNMKTNIVMFIIIIITKKKRMHNNSNLQSVIEKLIISILIKRMNVF